jgi:hypothetical protein
VRLAFAASALFILLPGPGHTQATTTCRTYGTTTQCTTNSPPDTRPVDQGSILRSGRDSVSQYPPTIREPQPLPSQQQESLKEDAPGAGLPQNGNELLALCDRPDTFARMTCLAWITGVESGLAAASVNDEAAGRPRLVCPPDRVTNGQIQDIVLVFLRQHPEVRHEDASLLSMTALRLGFPCRSQ